MRGSIALLLVIAISLVSKSAGEQRRYTCRGSFEAEAALQSNENVTVKHTKGLGYAFLINASNFIPAGLAGGPFLNRGVVFLPDDGVAPEAYAPLSRAVALAGCYAAIVERATVGRVIQAMLQNAAIEYWTLVGHGSSGGSVAARLVQSLQPKVKGLVLIAAAVAKEVDLVDANVLVMVLYGGNDTLVTPATVEASFGRVPGDADVTAFPHLRHYDFVASECAGNSLRPGASALTEKDFATLVDKLYYSFLLLQWAVAGKKALSFSDNERLIPGKNISKPYPGDIRVHYSREPIPNTSPQRWWYVFTPTVIKGGLVYYPGSAVDARAYFPLAFSIAARGHLVVLIQMPLRFATFHYKEANAVIDSPLFTNISNWAIGGHSLGGLANTLYVAEFGHRVYAAVMHAGLWQANLTENPLPVANIYGTLDNLTGGSDRYRSWNIDPPPLGFGPNVNLKTARFVTIEGANHYQDGDYGYQHPDEVAVISMEQQWGEVAQATVDFLHDVQSQK